MVFIYKSAIGVAFWAMLILVFFHYWSPILAKKMPANGRSFVSFAAGVSVAYVFLHMLPNLVEYNKPIGEFLIQNFHMSTLTELSIYIFTLIGFSIYYGVDLLAENYPVNDNRLYFLHLFMFSLYNFLITYTMSLRAEVSLLATILFTFAMALHFVLSDQKFCRLYPIRFNHIGRFVLMGALFLGWICSIIFNPVNLLVLAFLTSFLAGSVLLNVFREELPKSTLTSYPWFLAGVSVIALSLLTYAMLIAKAKGG